MTVAGRGTKAAFALPNESGQNGTLANGSGWPGRQTVSGRTDLRVDMPHKTALESVSAIVLCGDAIGSSGAKIGLLRKAEAARDDGAVRKIRRAWRGERLAGLWPASASSSSA